MKTKPSAFYAGQDDETREHMVIIEDHKECQCARPLDDHTENICFKYFWNVQEALAFEISFNRRNQ